MQISTEVANHRQNTPQKVIIKGAWLSIIKWILINKGKHT